MKQTALLVLGIIVLMSCHSKDNGIVVKFSVDMTAELENVEDLNTIGMGGNIRPLNWQEITPLRHEENGIYATEITFPSTVLGDTLRYQFGHDVIDWENWEYGAAGVRSLVFDDKKIILPVVKWEDFLIKTGRAKPRPIFLVRQSDTPAEAIILSQPFKGVTADGEIEEGLFKIIDTKLDVSPIKDAVDAFLNSLSEEQRRSCIFPVDADEWRRWLNTDFYIRKGISLKDLDETQKKLAFNILQTSMSPKGATKARDIMKMEAYLARVTKEFEMLGPELYWFTFMGEPGSDSGWGWQLDGHHLIINYFILGNQIVMTPTFMGSELRVIEDSIDTGTRTFDREEELAFDLYTSLTPDQQEIATLYDRKDFSYIQAPAYTDNAVVPYTGLTYDQMTSDQQNLLMELIYEYVGNMKEGHADLKMAEIKQHTDKLYFSWVGTASETGAFYYQIHSPVILIEFDHQAPVFLPGNKPTRKHVHSLVRTPNGNDYGKDLLRQHLEEHHHQ